MPKISIADAATKLGVSKEAIHNRIRRGSLKSVVENGIKFVLLNSEATNKQNIKQTNKRVTYQGDDKYYKLLEDQNERLREKVDRLEGETKSLREQKEQMLIQERIRIEQIYKDKDEQLKNMLNAISSKFLQHKEIVESSELVEAEIEVEANKEELSPLISLKKYLKSTSYSQKKLKKVKQKFKKAAKEDDARFVSIGKKYYLDTSKYDYSDLL